MNRRRTLYGALRTLPKLLGYVLRRFRLARLVLGLTGILLVIEYAVFSLMIPLAGTERPGSSGGSVLRFWTSVADALGLPASPPTWLWMFLVLLALRLALGFVQLNLGTWVAKQVHRHLSERTFGRVLMQVPMTEIYRRSIGYYLTLAGDDTFRAGTLINTASQVMAALTSVLAGFALLALFSPAVLGWTLAFLALCAAGVALAFRRLLRANQRAVELSREAGTAYVEALNGLRSIRSMGSERYFLDSYADQIGRYVRTLFEIDALKSTMKSMPALLAVVAGIVVLWPGSDRAGDLTAAYFLAATTLLMRVFVALGQLVNASSQLLMDLRSASDIDELIGADDGLDSGTVRASHAIPLSTIALKGIDYGYRPEHKVLDKLDFTFRAGQMVAIIGRSGSGKSTLGDLLLGLVRQDAGVIEVDGGEHTLAELRRRVILVEQQARLFTASVRDNLQLGLRCDDVALWEALRLVDMEAYVHALPGGLDALLEYQGANLSGGQRQRLGIARALIRNPQVLILDEATSALDAPTRLVVVRNLRASLRERVLIFITHDEALAAEADVVLDLGSRDGVVGAAPPEPVPSAPRRTPNPEFLPR